jgi:hypothetical protein
MTDEEMNDPPTHRPGATTLEIVFTWPGGREEVRYRRPLGSVEAEELRQEVNELRRRTWDSPYSWREV